jgi:Uma2 family endonuclease
MNIKTVEEYLNPEQYLNLERRGIREINGKWEYYKGPRREVIGKSLKHCTISTNLLSSSLKNNVIMHNYTIFSSDMRLYVPFYESYFYPDITVVRGKPLLKDRAFDNLFNQALIIEIISPGTEEYDRVDKFTAYQSILTLEEYILESSDKLQVEYFRRESPNQWKKIVYSKTDAILNFLNGELSVVIADIYRNVKF